MNLHQHATNTAVGARIVRPNPKGRPPGSRHRTTLAIEALLEGEAEAFTRKAIDMAMNGGVVTLSGR
jgi:hypothetical protein